MGAVWAKRDATPGRVREESGSVEGQFGHPSLHAQLHLLEQTSAGLWLLDPGGMTRWANEAAGELFGIRPADLMGEHVSRFIADADLALTEGHPADFKVARRDGTSIWLTASGRPLFDESGGPAGTLLTLHDIDERKRREAELRMRVAAKEALVKLAEDSLDAPDLNAILTESVRMVAEQLDAVLAIVGWIDLERRELWVLAADGHYDDDWLAEMRAGDPVPLPEESLAISAVESSSPVIVPDFCKLAHYDRRLAEHGIRSGAFVPLGDGQLILSSLSRRPGASGSSALALIQSVARLIVSYRSLEAQRCAAPQPALVRRGLGADHLAARRGGHTPRRRR